MTDDRITAPTSRKPLRLWPGVVAVVLQWVGWLFVPLVMPDTAGTMILAAFVLGIVILLWWLLFSRAPWVERLGAIALMVAGLFVTRRLVHASIANGMMGLMLVVYSIPVFSLALVSWAVLSRRFSTNARRVSMVAAILLACGAFTLIRTNGITGEAGSDLEWRWTKTAEERLLAQADDVPVAPPAASTPASDATTPAVATASDPAASAAPAAPGGAVPPVETGTAAESGAAATARADANTPVEKDADKDASRATDKTADADTEPDAVWPGFRGPSRDGVVRGVRIETDWSRTPPVELWRRPIGPAWSSFAVRAGRVYTQEQRGEEEMVSAYDLNTGQPVWRHRDAARFWESNAGAGPRATPTLSRGRVYTLGGTGILNALNARDGSVVWSRNAATDTGRKVPLWGIASSPLVIGDLVIAATAGTLVAYEAATGRPRWFGPKGGWGYSSPQLATIDGVTQIVFVNGPGAIGVAPADGTVLWKHAWAGDSIVQPAVLAGGDLLIGSGSGMENNNGMIRVTVAHESGGWSVKERWASIGLKPYYNDFVVHNGLAFGFDGSILACISLEDGVRKWKGGRYGHGQLMLLPEQDVLLVLSEEGELALVKATADRFTELARVPAIEGKTWNHPVLAGDVLLVRNGEEMVAFRLPLAAR